MGPAALSVHMAMELEQLCLLLGHIASAECKNAACF